MAHCPDPPGGKGQMGMPPETTGTLMHFVLMNFCEVFAFMGDRCGFPHSTWVPVPKVHAVRMESHIE